MTYKQVYIVRKDLNMRKGKIASQVGHACTNLFLSLFNVEVEDDGESWYKPKASISKQLLGWMNDNKKKITVSVDSEDALKEIHQTALDLGIPAVMVEDHGLTEFHGVHTLTVVGLGPWESEELDKLTGGLSLL
jgi:PTH2 family peptidyl-tRNA hydrolase